MRTPEGGIAVVVPSAGTASDQHFAHTYALAGELAKLVPTAVIVERVAGGRPPALPGVRTYIQGATGRGTARRLWELVRLVVHLRRSGFSTFFVRTSQTAAVPIALVTRLVGGRTLYWNCVHKPRARLRSTGLGQTLRSELPLWIAFRLADQVVTGTAALAAHYRTTHGISRRRMAVLPNEIDLARYAPATPAQRLAARAELGIPADARVVLSVHRLSPVRETGRYVPSVPEAVLAEIPDALFLLAGGGPDQEELGRAVARAGLEDRVRLLGPVPHAAISTHYHAADAFLMPSYTEGFPRVLLEAMAMGLPFASTDVGGVREIVPEPYRDRLAARDDPGALAASVIGLLADDGLAATLSAAGLGWVRRYDAPVVARQLVELTRAGDPAPARAATRTRRAGRPRA
jgi:glycosyltransferase involved in cell wall biosynthesis